MGAGSQRMPETAANARAVAISIEDLSGNSGFTRNVKGKVTLLPDPPRSERWYTVISCDDHVVEPPHTFEGRVPASLAERAPRGEVHHYPMDHFDPRTPEGIETIVTDQLEFLARAGLPRARAGAETL